MHQQKIFFVHKHSDDSLETESLWASQLNDDNYKIDNIPFIVRRIALDDVIRPVYDEDEKVYYFDGFVTVSGNTTVRLYFDNESLIESTRKLLDELGCVSEVFLARNIVAVNIPATVSYLPIKEFLEKGEMEANWKYEESCLCHEL